MLCSEAFMGAQTITLCEYQALARQLIDVQITQTDGLLMTRGFLPGRGYLLALQPFASGRVTILDASPTRAAHANATSWFATWLNALRSAA